MDKHFFSVLLFIILFSFFTAGESCTASADQEDAPVPVAAIMSGNLEILVLCPEPGSIQADEAEIITLKTPLEPAAEIKHYWDGNSVFYGSPEDGAPFMKFGHRDYREMFYKGKKSALNSFKKEGESWACVIDGVLYLEAEEIASPVAECRFRTYKSEKGEERSALMCRRLEEGEDWYFKGHDNRVYRQDEDGSLSQEGWMSWHIASLPSGEKILLLMARGMDSHALWTGTYSGKRYTGREADL